MKQKDRHRHKDSDFDRYHNVYQEIEQAYPQFWKWVGFGILLLAFLFALPYLFEHSTKTITAYKDLKGVIRKQ